MPVQLMSPRLPGVNVLATEASGPQYTRWRRGVKSAFEAKGTWGHCDGTNPMPMPESGPNFFSPVNAPNPQPELLEERREWVKSDRDVKLDIFLSVSDDIKLEVFEVGPPLPPPSMTAMQMMEALDEHFEEFKFEDYHHVFCHFLNLHIDQYASLDEFNNEFAATLEDLLDHGFPLNDVQACSAYFSKLRCTQNPWVAKKLKEWDTLESTPLLAELMKDCPPWMIIRPLTTKPLSQTSVPEMYSEDVMGTSSIKEEDEHSSSESEKSDVTTPSTVSSASHSRNTSAQSLEITVGASVEDLTVLKVFPASIQKAPRAPRAIPKRLSSKSNISKMSLPSPVNSALPPPINRPLPPLPDEKARSRSASPKLRSEATKATTLEQPEVRVQKPTRVQTPQPQTLEQTHPAFRPSTPMPPAASTPALTISTSTSTTPNLLAPSTPEIYQKRPASSHAQSPPTLAPPFSFSPDLTKRPSSSRGPVNHIAKASIESTSTWPPSRSTPPSRSSPLIRRDSNNSSIISLPLQGTTIQPEYRDTVMSGPGITNPTALGLGLGFPNGRSLESSTTLVGSANTSLLSASPPRSLMSRLSAELNDDEKKGRKRSMSWGIKAKANLSARLQARRFEVKEII